MARGKPHTEPIKVGFDFVGEVVTRTPAKIGNGAHIYVDKDWAEKKVWVILPKEPVRE